MDDGQLRAKSSSLIQSLKIFFKQWQELSPLPNLKLFALNPRADVLAGITVAIISIPMALAFGVASGLGAATGVWGTVCGGLFVGLFGGSAVGISGPTSPKVVQLAMVMKDHTLNNGAPDLTFAFSLVALSGIILIIFSLCRIGKFIYYTPYSVVSGFMCGIGLILILLQINPMLGVAGADSLMHAIASIPESLSNYNAGAILISLSVFVVIVIWERFRPLRWLPSPLVGLVVGIVLGQVLPYEVEYLHMSTGMPELYIPDISMFSDMIGPALSLAGLCLFDSLLTCLVADTMTHRRHNSNRELFGQGVANIFCGLIGGVTTATATMRTVANIKSGARSGLASVTMGLTMLAFMLGLAGYADYVPMACLAGILLKIGLDILDYRVLPVFQSLPWPDKMIFITVLLLTIFADLLIAVGVGLLIAFVHFIREVSRLYGPRITSLDTSGDIEVMSNDEDLIISLDGPMFFGIADSIYRTMDRMMDIKSLKIKLDRVNYMDLTGAYLLEDLLKKAAGQRVEISIEGALPPVVSLIERLRIVGNKEDIKWNKNEHGAYKVEYVN